MHKIPETILSRAQVFNLQKLGLQEVVGRLQAILTEEKLEFEQTALELIAAQGAGSMRDSLSLLDQVIICSGSEGITADLVRSLLGLLPHKLALGLLENLIARNGREILF